MADSRKRRISRPFEGQAYTKKKFDFANVVGYRFLIPSKAAGTMIGKGGEVIKRIRSEFNCRIIVPDSQGPERMVIMDGEIDIIIDIWRDVIPLIKDSINAKECDYKNAQNKYIEDDNEIDLRLIVHESQAGALIGKGGERIRNLIDSHKMTIIKLYPSFCPNSTDRVVRLVSSKDNLLACLKSMLNLLANQAVKGVRNDYDPDNYDESIAQSYGGFISKDSRFKSRGLAQKPSMGSSSQRPGDMYHEPRGSMFDRVDNNQPRSSFFSSSSNSRNPPVGGISDLLEGIIRLSSNSSSEKHIARVSLPIPLVGSVIGTDGHRLSDIKRDSGAHIQLDEERLSDREELFLIRGTPDQIYKAQCLMQLCVRKYGDMGHFGY